MSSEANKSRDNGALLRVEDLDAGYRKQIVVRKASITLRQGEVVGLAGRNGSGKSTLLMGIAGLIWSHARSIVLDEAPIADLAPHERAKAGLGIVLQRNGLFFDLSINENLLLAGTNPVQARSLLTGCPAAEALASIISKPSVAAGALSGGERRLLALTMVLARQPVVLLADEPTLGLAPEIEACVVKVLQNYAAFNGRSVVFVSHDLDLLEATCQRTYTMAQGQISGEFVPGHSSKTLKELVLASPRSH